MTKLSVPGNPYIFQRRKGSWRVGNNVMPQTVNTHSWFPIRQRTTHFRFLSRPKNKTRRTPVRIEPVVKEWKAGTLPVKPQKQANHSAVIRTVVKGEMVTWSLNSSENCGRLSNSTRRMNSMILGRIYHKNVKWKIREMQQQRRRRRLTIGEIS